MWRVRLKTKLFLVAVVFAAVVSGGAIYAQQGSLTVTPDSGPAGTRVLLEGEGCNNPGQRPLLIFQNGDEATGGTVGAEMISADIPAGGGSFQVFYTIPLEFAEGSLQGRGGGALSPGVYQITSRPPYCQAFYTVTAALPQTGGGLAKGGQHPWILVLTGVSALATGIIALVIVGAVIRR